MNACNFACHYCYVPHLRRFVDPSTIEKHSINQAKFSSLLGNLVGYCQEKGLTELHVTFAGGEPTLNLPLVEEFCRQAEEIGGPIRITFGMISNGSFTADALLPLLRRYDMRIDPRLLKAAQPVGLAASEAKTDGPSISQKHGDLANDPANFREMPDDAIFSTAQTSSEQMARLTELAKRAAQILHTPRVPAAT